MNSTADRIREIALTLHADCDREEEGHALRKIADEIDARIAAAVLAEREACAKEAEDDSNEPPGYSDREGDFHSASPDDICDGIARAIRARK